MRNHEKNISGDLSAVESVGITFAISAEVLFRIGAMLYRSVPITDVFALLFKYVLALAVIGLTFGAISCTFSILACLVFGYERPAKAVAHVVKSALQCMLYCLVFFLPQACLFVGLSLVGIYLEAVEIFLITTAVVLIIFVLSGALRGKKVGAPMREGLASLAIGILGVLLGLPFILISEFWVACLISLAVAIIVRTAAIRITSVNRQLRKNAIDRQTK